MCVTKILFGFYYLNTKRTIQEFNTVVGKDGGAGDRKIKKDAPDIDKLGYFHI
ncbi:MAG: hypothetical protein LBD29_09045 [Treponema sp.]|nr:hypothetical protein [Treponema sp.]